MRYEPEAKKESCLSLAKSITPLFLQFSVSFDKPSTDTHSCIHTCIQYFVLSKHYYESCILPYRLHQYAQLRVWHKQMPFYFNSKIYKSSPYRRRRLIGQCAHNCCLEVARYLYTFIDVRLDQCVHNANRTKMSLQCCKAHNNFPCR